MALIIKDRVRETTNTIGTGTVTLAGAVTGYQTFSSALSNNDTCYYTIAGTSSSEWEVGLGTYSTNTLARNTVLASSNGGSLVVFSSGTKDVFITYPAGKAVYEDANNNLLLASTVSVLDSTNNVGINEPSPGYPLVVSNPTGSVQPLIFSVQEYTGTYGSVSVTIDGVSGSSELVATEANNYDCRIGVDATSAYIKSVGHPSGLAIYATCVGINTTGGGSYDFEAGTAGFSSIQAGAGTFGTLNITGTSFSVSSSLIGSQVAIGLTNTGVGGAKLTISTAGITALSDASLTFNNSTATAANWTIGCDGNDNKAFKISRSTTLGTNDAVVVRNDNQSVGIGASYANITAPLTVGGIAAFAAGAVGTPSIARSTDLNTGFWFPAADTIAASTNGAERIRITSAGDVGIGETAPDYKLDVNGSFGFTPGASVDPADNGDVVFQLTSNTSLTIKAKGSDGIVRSVSLTLA
jgi:hypothetical protein